MGDTVAVVVSEERGKTSIAVNGRLFEMRSTRELEANLSYLLGLKEYGGEQKTFIDKIIDKFRGKKDDSEQDLLSQEDVGKASKTKAAATAAASAASVPTTQVEVAGESSVPITIRTRDADQTSNSQRVGTPTRIIFIVLSFFLSLFLWVYIQVINNPVVTRNITVPISQYQNLPDNAEVSYPIKSVDLEIVGRAGTINKLTVDDIVVSVDYSEISEGDMGVVELPINVSSADGNIYFRVEHQLPETISVTVYSSN
jgi:hypothetical protein